MKISKQHKENEYILENANVILQDEFCGDIKLFNSVIKSILHTGIIESLYNTGMLQQLIFHGGTCLQRIYHSERLSEDLDFTINTDLIPISDFMYLCSKFKEILENDFLRNYRIDPEDIFFKENKNNFQQNIKGDVCTWKIAVILRLGEQRQLVKIDVENRKNETSETSLFEKLQGDCTSVKPIWITSQTQEEILINKCIAIFQRKRLQLRDFYDLGFLISHGIQINYDMLNRKIEQRMRKEEFIEAINRRKAYVCDIKNIKPSIFNELQRFIPSKKITTILCDDFFQCTIQKIQEYCEKYTSQGIHFSLLTENTTHNLHKYKTSTNSSYRDEYNNLLQKILIEKQKQITMLLERLQLDLQRKHDELEKIQSEKPNILIYLFNRRKYTEWCQREKNIEARIETLRSRFNALHVQNNNDSLEKIAKEKIKKISKSF